MEGYIRNSNNYTYSRLSSEERGKIEEYLHQYGKNHLCTRGKRTKKGASEASKSIREYPQEVEKAAY